MKQSSHEKLEQALRENKALREELKLRKQLSSSMGFYHYYFKQLPNYNTNVECFNAVNELYFRLNDEYRYSSYHSFAASKLYRKKK